MNRKLTRLEVSQGH